MSDHSQMSGPPSVPADVFNPPPMPSQGTDFPLLPPGFGPGSFPHGNPHFPPGLGPLGMPPRNGTNATNGMAIAGVVLAVFFWPLGLVFSIIGLVKSKALGGVGRTMAIVGLVLSTIFGVGTIVGAVVLVNVVKNAPALDPGCRYTEPAIATFLPEISADQTNVDNDIASDNQAAMQTDTTKTVGDLQSLQIGFDRAIDASTHESLKAAAGVATNDVTALTTDLESLEIDSPDSVTPLQVDTDFGTLTSDILPINTICGTF